MLRIEVGQVFHHFLSVQEAVDEADEQVLVDFGTKQFLESEVGVGVDVSVAEFSAVHKSMYFRDVTFAKIMVTNYISPFIWTKFVH